MMAAATSGTGRRHALQARAGLRAGLPAGGALVAALLAACAAVPPDLRTTLTRDRLDRVTTPLMLAEVAELPAQATLAPWGDNRGVVTWRTADGVSLSFAEGVLTATRGLGFDLMSADTAGTRAALAGRSTGPYERFVSFLDGEGRTYFRTLVCTMSAPVPERIDNIGLAVDTRRHAEHCRSTSDDVTNLYWTGPDGTMWRSRQWIGPDLGDLVTERLVE